MLHINTTSLTAAIGADSSPIPGIINLNHNILVAGDYAPYGALHG